MKNILEEFWYGNIDPMEQSAGKSPAVKELIRLLGRNRDRLCDTMTAEQKEKVLYPAYFFLMILDIFYLVYVLSVFK